MGSRTIYRVETRLGEGPYVCHGYTVIHGVDQGTEEERRLRPSTMRDGDLRREWIEAEDCDEEREEWYFGFADMRQYDRWFGGARLSEWSLCLAAYVVPAQFAVASNRQCIFKKGAGTFLGRHWIRD